MKNIQLVSEVSDSIHKIAGMRSCFVTTIAVVDEQGNSVTVRLTRKELKRLVKAAKAQLKSI